MSNKVKPTPLCICGEVDTVEHTILDCNRFDAQRVKLLAAFNYVDWPPANFDALISSKEILATFRTFSEEVLIYTKIPINTLSLIMTKDLPIPPLVWMDDIRISSTVYSIKTLSDFPILRLKFGFFLDKSYPSTAVFKEDPPWIYPLVGELLKNDEIAFRVRESAINFQNFCSEMLNMGINKSEMYIKRKKKCIKLCALSMGIPFDRYQRAMMLYLPVLELPPFETCFLFRIDFLTIGSSQRMRKRFIEFGNLIEYEPTARGMIVFLQVILLEGGTSESIGGAFSDERDKIELMADEVNAKYSSTKWRPIIIMYGLPSQPELEPFYEDIRYIYSYGMDDFPVEKEFILFETNTTPSRLVFTPYFGCNWQVREANIRKQEIPLINDKIMDCLYKSDDLKLEEIKGLKVHPVPFMKEYLMKILLFAADCVVTVEMMEMAPVTHDYLDSVLTRVVDKCPHITLVMDFDGTMVDRPKGARHKVQLDPKIREAVRRLADCSMLTIIVVSGRNEDDLLSQIGLSNITYVGNHGYQIYFNDETRWIYQVDRDTLNSRMEMINDIHKSACMHGAYLTDYGGVQTFSSRQAAPTNSRALVDKARAIAESYGFTVSKWRDGIKIKHTDVDTGQAIVRVLERYIGANWPLLTRVLYVGDDSTDEDTVKFLQSKCDVAMLRVTKGFFPKTVAICKLPCSTSVLTFLEWLQINYVSKASSF